MGSHSSRCGPPTSSRPGGVGELQQPGGLGLADVQHAGQPLLVADADAAAAQQPGRLLLEDGEQLADLADALQRRAGRPPVDRRLLVRVRPRGSGRSRGGPKGRSPRRCRPISRGSSTLSASMRASSPRWRSRRAGVRAPSAGSVGQVPDRALAGQPLQDGALVRRRARRARRPGRRAAGGAVRRPGGRARRDAGRRGAPGRGRAAARRPTAGPGWSSRSIAAAEDVVRAARGGPRAARRRRHAVGRWRAGPRRGPAGSRRPARRGRGRPRRGPRAGWPARRRRTARGGRRRDGPPATRSAARRCGCAARRRASQEGPWASGPRYVVAATDAADSMERCTGRPDDPQTRTALAAHQAGALRWLGGGRHRRRPRGASRGRGRGRGREPGRRVPVAGPAVIVLVLLGVIGAVGGCRRAAAQSALAPGAGRHAWQIGRLRIAGPAIIAFEPEGYDELDPTSERCSCGCSAPPCGGPASCRGSTGRGARRPSAAASGC